MVCMVLRARQRFLIAASFLSLALFFYSLKYSSQRLNRHNLTVELVRRFLVFVRTLVPPPAFSFDSVRDLQQEGEANTNWVIFPVRVFPGFSRHVRPGLASWGMCSREVGSPPRLLNDWMMWLWLRLVSARGKYDVTPIFEDAESESTCQK